MVPSRFGEQTALWYNSGLRSMCRGQLSPRVKSVSARGGSSVNMQSDGESIEKDS